MLQEYPIIAKSLSYKIGFKTIIENISLALKRNEFIGLIGGSGSGKTTLLTCLNGYRNLTSGKVFLNGIPCQEKDKIRHMIGYVPQDDIVHKSLTIKSALYYSFLLRNEDDVPEKKIEFHIDKILHHLDLTEHKNKKISSLSGGQRKRVNIGVELLHSPELFFLDEPTSGLDPSLERQLMRLLRSLADDNRLIILTTHLMQNIDMFDVLIFIHKGQMVYFGPSNEIIAYFQAKDMIDLFEKIALLDPYFLKNRYLQSSVYQNFLVPRLTDSGRIQ